MEPHNWRQESYEPSHLYQGILTAVQFYKCRKCKAIVGLPDHPSHQPPERGCTGLKVELVEKEKWRSPMRTKSVEKRDYPAKKAAKGGSR